jgi:acyl carrier protein
MSMPLSIFEQVRGVAADVFEVSAEQITADSSPEVLENWDSVQHLNLVLALEQQFGIQLEPEEMDRMKTIGAFAELVRSKSGQA